MYGFKDSFLYCECKAKDLLKQLEIEIPYNLEQIMLDLNIIYQEKSLGNSIAGVYTHSNNNHGILVNKNIKNTGRKRFTIAHEIGHYWIDTHNGNNFTCKNSILGSFRENIRIEKEADIFAATFLMPEHPFKKDAENITPSINGIIDLSKKYRTSITSTAIRYIKYCIYPCSLVYLINNTTSWIQNSRNFVGDVNRKPLNCNVNDMFQNLTEHHITEKIYSEYWVSGAPCNYVTEDTIFFTDLNHALVLIVEDIEDEDYIDDFN